VFKWKLKVKTSAFLWSIFKAFFIALIILINPLGLKTTSQNQSEMLYVDATASSFDAKNEVATVILIDNYTLDKGGYSYPLSYRTLARILKTIDHHEPSAVFIDLFQHYEHSLNLNSWLNQLKFSSENFPIFLAQDLEFDTAERLSNKNNIRSKLKEYTIFSPASWKESSKAYPLFISSDNKKVPTTSMLMYKHYCQKNKCQTSPNKSENSFYDSMVVRWNNSISKNQHKFYKVPDKCNFQESSMINAIKRHVSYGFRTSSDIAADRVRCSPILTISAADILDDEARGNQNLNESIKSKFVFIGYNLDGSSDTVISPVHGQFPGVFFHAMSFINLVTSGDTYWKSPKAIGNYSFTLMDIIQVSFYFIALSLSFYIKSIFEAKKGGAINKRLVVCCFVVMAITFFIFLIVSNISGPLNWIALFGIFSLCLSSLIRPTFHYYKKYFI